MIDFPRIETERLILDVPDRDGYLLLRDLHDDPEVHRYLGPPADDPTTDMFSRALRGAGSWLLYGYGMFMVWEKDTGAFVGQVGVFHTMRGFGKGMDDVPEVGWILARPYWGRGYATEAIRAAIDWFDKSAGPQRITCMIEQGNDASFALAKRLGFVRFGEHVVEDDIILDLLERRVRV